MRDPYAPEEKDPYHWLELDSDATPDLADEAMDARNEDNPGHELEVIDARDAIRNPARRLAVDILRYMPPEGSQVLPPDERRLFAMVLAATREDMNVITKGLQFGPSKDIVPVNDLINKEDAWEQEEPKRK